MTRSLFSLLFGGMVTAFAVGSSETQYGLQQSQAGVVQATEIDVGFQLLYQLKFVEAREQFAAWQALRPQDPLGDGAEAASYLFEECYRQEVLTSEFFLDDKRFLGKVALKPDARLRQAFFAAVRRAQELSRILLQADRNDAGALFAMTLSLGLEADYASLIDMEQRESLRMLGEANEFAKRLLSISTDADDAYLTLGTANYVIGSLPFHKRFLLRLSGIRGNKQDGVEQLKIAAASGRYFRPFAKMLLALVALREGESQLARIQLAELVAEFPENALFSNELAKLVERR